VPVAVRDGFNHSEQALKNETSATGPRWAAPCVVLAGSNWGERVDRARVLERAEAAGYLEDGRPADLLALCLMLFMVANSVAMSLMPIVQDGLQTAFSFSSSQIGFLTSVFMLAFALGSIPMGLACARWGGRILIAGALVLAAGSLLFAFSASYEWFLAGRLLQGIGASAVIPVSNHLMAHTIPPNRQARALGIFGTGHGLGVVAALLIMPSVQAAGGYRAVFLLTAGMGVVLALVAGAQRQIRAGAGERSAEGAIGLLREVGSVAANRRLLLLAVINIGVMAIVVGILAWTPPFLHDQRGASLAVAAYLTAGVGVAQMLGNIAGAMAMARWGKPLVLLVGMVVMLIATALAPVVPGFAAVVACVVVAGFLTMVLFPAIMGSVPDIVRRRSQVGAASGFLNLTNLLGTLFAPWIFGVLLDSYGKGPKDGGYLAGYLWLALFPLLGSIAGILYMATRRSATAAASESRPKA
jgi:ACS family hexuronate transporter-like MFS transporter